ncbi:MAG: hypothetical protein AAFQ20_02550, partial [Bacteroidota bacterium]
FAFDHGIPRSQYGRYETGTDIRYTSLLKIAHIVTLECHGQRQNFRSSCILFEYEAILSAWLTFGLQVIYA